MKPSHAVKVILSIAAHEAGPAAIEIEHFLIGLLKFAGVSDPELSGLFNGIASTDDLRSDRNELVRTLHDQHIQVPEASRRLYRELRNVLKHSAAIAQRAMTPGHRSAALKMRFAAAETAAAKMKMAHITPAFLYTAIFQQPPENVKIAFRRQNIGMAPSGAEDPDRQSKTGFHPIAAPPVDANAPLVRDDALLMVIEREFRNKNGKNLLLVNRSRGKIAKRIAPLARYLNAPAGNGAGTGTEDPFSLTQIDTAVLDSAPAPEPFYAVCRTISANGVNILFFDFLHRFFRKGEPADFRNGLKKLLHDTSIRVLAGIDRYHFAEHITTDATLLALFTVIRVRDDQADTYRVPGSL